MTYLVLIGFIFILTTLSFAWIGRKYIIHEVKSELEYEAENIVNVIDKTLKASGDKLSENLNLRRSLRVAGSLIESSIIVTRPGIENRFVFTNLEASERQEVLEWIKSNRLEEEHLVVNRPVLEGGKPVANVIVFTKLKAFKPLNQVMRRSLILSLLIAGIFSFVFAKFFEKRLSKPIRQLEKSMAHYAPNKPFDAPSIRTGDEIEALSHKFMNMVATIQTYDASQKSLMQNTSHELKTPLMSIQGYAEGILEGVLEGEEATNALHVIVSESKRLKKTVDEVLYLSKLESDQVHLKKAFVSMEELGASAIRAVKPLADERGIALRMAYALGEKEDQVFLDGEKVMRALVNLLGNAIRHAKSKVTLEIILENDLIIDVADDGEGFSKEALGRAFDRFFKGAEGGTGLGLTITRAIVEAHGGKIQNYNTEHGAHVRLNIPLH